MPGRRDPGGAWSRNDEAKGKLIDDGYDLDKVLSTDDLVAGRDVFIAATGVTGVSLLRGVRYQPDGRGHRVDRHAFALGDRSSDRS